MPEDFARDPEAAHAVEPVDSRHRAAMSVQSFPVMHPINAYGTETQRETCLPKLASGEWEGCFGLTAPDDRSDPPGRTTRAKPAEGGYLLLGAKTSITNSLIADVFASWAKSEAHDGRIMGLIPKKCLAGPFGCLNRARYGIACGVKGAAEACWRLARRCTPDRVQFGIPQAQPQVVPTKRADMQTDISLGLLGACKLGRTMDDHTPPAEPISVMKRNNCGKAPAIARETRDMHGGNGVSDKCGAIRHMMNRGAVKAYEGTHDIHVLILGRARTGLQVLQ